MDPLSITVAITALIGTANQLKNILSDAKNANKEQSRLLIEVNGWSILLKQWNNRLKGARAEDEWFQGLLELAKPDGTDSAAGNFIPNERYRPDGVFVQLQEAYDGLVAELRPEHVHGWRRLGHRLKWSWDKDAINTNLVEVNRLTNLIKSILDEDHFKASQDIQKKVAAIDERQQEEKRIKEERRQQKERDAIVKWLSPLDFFAKQKETFAKAAPIGQWLLDDSEEFREWVSGPHCWRLNIFGPPGVGKVRR